MAAIKIGTSILYLILGYVAISYPLTLGANISLGVLVLLVIVHLGECFMYRDLIRQAPGSKTWHVLNVFLYGVLHMMVMKDAVRVNSEEAA